jgi:hypothetical protein
MRAIGKVSIGRRKIHVDLPEEIHRKLRVKAALEDVSMQAFVARVVDSDRQLNLSLVRLLEIVGEAATRGSARFLPRVIAQLLRWRDPAYVANVRRLHGATYWTSASARTRPRN